jgi:[acyl-carrier-protein] S-malonyltransferase
MSERRDEQGELLKKIAFLFPGQGSQKVGMGHDLYIEHAATRELFEAADRVCGLPIRQLCFEGPMERLTETVNLQPAITVVNLACLALIREAGIKPEICAGHSLGEYSALQAADVISSEDCLRLVFKRGQLMHREATRHPGAMSAIIGLAIQEIDEIVAGVDGIVAVANHNSADQIVITGEPTAVQAVGQQAVTRGGRAIALKVSGAWHSPLIQGAEAAFGDFLETISFGQPSSQVIHNVTAESESDSGRIRVLLARQLCSPVRWYDAMRRMIAEPIDIFVEIGPGKVLAGLLKKTLPQDHPASILNVSDLKSLGKFIEAAQ